MYRRTRRGHSGRTGPSTNMSSDNSDGGAPLYSPGLPTIKKTSTTVETGRRAAPEAKTSSIAPVSGGAPLNGKSTGSNVKYSADTGFKLANSLGSKLNPNIKDFVPPPAGSKNGDVKAVTDTGGKDVKIKKAGLLPQDTDVLLKMINSATAQLTYKTNGQITSRVPNSRTFNDGFGNAPSFMLSGNDIDQGHAAGPSTFTGPPMHFQQIRYPGIMQDFDRINYANGTMHTGQQEAGNSAQSYSTASTSAAQSSGYNSSCSTNQYPENLAPMNIPMPTTGCGQQTQTLRHGAQHIAPGDGGHASRDYRDNDTGDSSGRPRMNTTAFQEDQRDVHSVPREHTEDRRNNADLANQIAASRQTMDQYATSPAAPYGNITATQMAHTPKRTINRANTVNVPTPARAHIPATTSGLEALLGITKSVPMFQPPTDDVKAQRSPLLNRLVGDSGLPTMNSLMDPDTFPFIEPGRAHTAVDYGVIKLKNIPYTTTRSEVIAVLGKNAKILNDNLEPVHIIMERVTSKTNDAYVEVLTLDDAINVVDRYYGNKTRAPRLGERPIEIEVSSQSQLMKDLFPVASGVIWHGSIPEIKPSNCKEPWENFKTFVTAEEMTMLVKHVEVPQRSPFSRESPERPYESIISTLKKLPWYMTDYITIKQRHFIYDACFKLVSLLKHAISKRDVPFDRSPRNERIGADRLTEQLYRRLIKAIMLCPGFTVCQKDNIADLVEMGDKDMRDFNMPRFSYSWLHLYTLGPKPGIPLDVLEYYIALIREETNRVVQAMSIREKQELADIARHTDGYWGFFWREVGYKGISGAAFDNITLAGAAHMEWEAVDRILRRAIVRGREKDDDDHSGNDDSVNNRKETPGSEHRAMVTYYT